MNANMVSLGIYSQSSKERTEFIHHVEQLLKKLVSYLPIDSAVDQVDNFVLSSLACD